ncbi:hypothetical protein SUGI_0925050 [Cryptomeria japonica]|uniref:uncharacterized protein LOC131029743 n=1 Tax=Cryptomeria japonica TaxID=3369 RepID=UPI002414CD8A|nr:uncharacterized protein LOC131029743 [Cryptomeria japonica]GLJ44257.1 hypothetical protein SUGI_0925050 [Cryptomeria japonica]
MDGAAVPSQPYSPQAEINWDRLDKTKFYAIGAGLFTSVTVGLYPISVVKTRLQVTIRQGSNPSAISIFRNILKADGVSGLYRGFGTVVTGAVPGRIIFLTTLETTKIGALTITEKLNLPEPTQAAIANGVAGMISSLAAQSVFVPLDVVSQRLMVQGTAGAIKYRGGFDAARKIIKTDGIRGLYRGFGMSVLTYSPTSAVWWASYGSSQRVIWRSLGYSSKDNMQMPSQGQIILVQALGGFFAGAVASCVTTPLDTIKTRLQVLDTESKPSVKRTIKRLMDEDGWKGFYRGIGPRFFSMSAWGTSMILAYEYLKRICAKHEHD